MAILAAIVIANIPTQIYDIFMAIRFLLLFFIACFVLRSCDEFCLSLNSIHNLQLFYGAQAV
jgi:hypothetical protein